MADIDRVSVLVIGAGPTGLALACDLARRGVLVGICDKAPAAPHGSRGKGLQPRTLEVFDDLGVIDAVLDSGQFHLAYRAYGGGALLGDKDMHQDRHPTPDVPYASPLIVPQWRVEEILRQRLAQHGVAVSLATELVGLSQDEDGVLAKLTHEGEERFVRADYLVAADGGHSFVRKTLGVPFEGESWPTERMLIADVDVEGLDREHWHTWPMQKKGWLALCPFRCTELFQLQAQLGPEDSDEASPVRMREIVAERTEGFPSFSLGEPRWMSLYRANIRMVKAYRTRRILLAGDAAHVHSPVGGQGMNTGVQDAYNLGWKLAAALAGAEDTLLDTYEEERLPIAATMLGLTSRLHRTALDGDTVNFQPPSDTLQLGLHYRSSSLSAERRAVPGKLQAGDRAPDAPCVDATGTRVRLFDAFRGPHFTLLLFTDHGDIEALDPAATGTLHVCRIVRPSATAADSPEHGTLLADSGGFARAAYDVGGDAAVLVRPDGYVALTSDEPSVRQSVDYLRRHYRWISTSSTQAPRTPAASDSSTAGTSQYAPSG